MDHDASLAAAFDAGKPGQITIPLPPTFFVTFPLLYGILSSILGFPSLILFYQRVIHVKNYWKRLLSGALSLVLAGSLILPGGAAELPETPLDSSQSSGELLDVTAGTYTPAITAQPGGLYTLIALPATPAENAPQELTAADLVRASGDALFIGSAVADQSGKVTFQNVRLRTAQAAVYYVTGPGLSVPYREATGLSTSAMGQVHTASQDSSARITLVDKDTDYRYNTGLYADASGNYTVDNLAPGRYKLRVEKPGYLPYLSASETDYLDVTDDSTALKDIDITANVGDVDNNGVRDMTDLAALLLYYGKTAPEGMTADLDHGGSVGSEDVELLVPHLTTGTQSGVTGATLNVRDDGGADDASLRYLTFSLDAQASVSAAAFSLTYRTDTVQPLTSSGGRISPVDGGAIADCLVVADGFTASLTGWKVEKDLVTLSFALSSETPHAAGELARFYYQPISGSTASLHHGAFQLSQAAALVGKDTVVTDNQLTFPNCDAIPIDNLVIDQKANAPITLRIPALGETTDFPLSATGYVGSTAYPELKGVLWTLDQDYGGQVTVNLGLLTVSAGAPEGTVTLRAQYTCLGVTHEDTLELSLEREPSAPHTVKLSRNSTPCGQSDTLELLSGQGESVTYTAKVYDQYDREMADAPVTWSLSHAPAGLSIRGGVLTADWSTLKAGTHTFDLSAQTDRGIQTTLHITLTVEAQLGLLGIDGPTSANLPTKDGSNLVLTYRVSAYDQQGQPMSLGGLVPTFTVSPSGNGVTASREVDGTYLLTVTPVDDPDTQAGTYTLSVVSGQISASREITLLAPGQTQTAVQAMIYAADKDGALTAPASTWELDAGSRDSLALTARLLGADSQPLETQNGQWEWTLSGGNASITLDASGADATLQVGADLDAGSYALSLTATESQTGLSVTLPVDLVVRPALASLVLDVPSSLPIPEGRDLVYTLSLSARDSSGHAMSVPAKLEWSVAAKGSNSAAGVSVDQGVLTITPAATPGVVSVSVTHPATHISESQDIILESVGQGMALTLYRQITVDGKVVQESAPVSLSGNTVDIKEGQSAVYTYTAMLMDRSTGKATAIPPSQIRWVGTQDGVFTVDERSQPGSYSSTILALYEDQGTAASSQVNVYPNITDLRLDFGQDFELEPPYTLGVPAAGSKIYTGKLMATIVREGKLLSVPLSELGLGDYTVTPEWQLTGVYITLDQTAGALKVQVDPVAIQNPMDPPESGEADTRVLTLHLQYFPGETLDVKPFPFYLEKEVLKPTDAVLRRGVGTGADFAFDTPQSDHITAPAGVLTNAYALEILDQYRRPLTGQGDVTWTLSGAPRDAEGNYLVTLTPVNDLVESSYPNFSSVRRLRVAAGTAPGTYPLTLSAACGDFTRTISIRLTVTAQAAASPFQIDLSSADNTVTIPRRYLRYNSTALNTAVATAPFLSTIRSADGYELDPQSCQLTWAIATPAGKEPAGVSVAADPKAPGSATVSVNKDAVPTGSEPDKLLVLSATVQGQDGTALGSATTGVQLVRASSTPTLLSICQGGKAVTKDDFKLSSSATTSRVYTFTLVDQYGQTSSQAQMQKVSWSVANDANTGVTIRQELDANKLAAVRVTVTRPSKSATVNLTASFRLDPNDPTSQLIYATIPLTITVSSSGDNSGDNNGGGGGGGGGGGSDIPDTTAGVPSRAVISGSTSLSTPAGTATSQVYSCVLRDKNDLKCDLSYQSKITWSASGLTGGITFNTSTRTLNVPASTPAGTYRPTITAAYSTSVRSSITVTVTVTNGPQASAAPSATPTSSPSDVTLRPTVTQSGSAGTATLTTAQEQALLGAGSGSGGTVTIEPTGGNGLTSLTLSLTANTAAAIASQKGRSLQLKSTLGTLTLSPQSLQSLASRGGSTVTITLAASGNTLRVDLVCGASATSLPGLITLNAPASGNLVSVVNADGTERILKKALVENGRVIATLPGSVQLKFSTRSPNFSDIQSHWAQSSIVFTTSRELFQGTSATTFDPGGNMTRSMLVTVLHRLEDTPTPGSLTQFRDVEQNSWYTNAVSWAHNKGIVQGTSTGFEPATPVSREQLATILYRYAASLGVSTSQRGNLSGFSDQSRVSTWARDAVEWAVSVKLINGKTGGVLDPGGYASRAEVSTILERFIRYLAPTV